MSYKTCPNSFECGREKGELGNTIALQEMEIDRLNALVLSLQKPIPPPPPQFTDEEIWLRAWNSCMRSSTSNLTSNPTNWADECLKKYRIKFPVK